VSNVERNGRYSKFLKYFVFVCYQGTVESDEVGFDLVSGSTDLGSSNGSLVFVKYIQPNSSAYGKLRYLTYSYSMVIDVRFLVNKT